MIENYSRSYEDILIANALNLISLEYFKALQKFNDRVESEGLKVPTGKIYFNSNPPYELIGAFEDNQMNNLFVKLNSYSYAIYIMSINLCEAISNSFIISTIDKWGSEEVVKNLIRKTPLLKKFTDVPKKLNPKYNLDETNELYHILSKGILLRNDIIHTKYSFEDASEENILNQFTSPSDHISHAEETITFFFFKIMQLPFNLEKHLYQSFPELDRNDLLHVFDTVKRLELEGKLHFVDDQ